MWARVVEVMLAAFLSISSFIFPDDRPLWIFDVSVAVWIWIFSLASFYDPLRKLHLMNLLAVLVLALFTWIQPEPPPPAPFQNYAVLALLLLLFAIIPSHASAPPEPWSKYYRRKQDGI